LLRIEDFVAPDFEPVLEIFEVNLAEGRGAVWLLRVEAKKRSKA